MRTVTYRLADLEKKVSIHIGRLGENEVTRVQIDAGSLFAEYPDAVASMSVENPEGVKYPATVTRDGDMVIWDVRDSDLAKAGHGEIQWTFTENGAIIKSAIARTSIGRSIVGDGEAPDPLEDWIEHAEDVLEQVDGAFPKGGSAGQVLAKKSGADYDTEWVNQGSGGTGDYEELENLPKIGGVELKGDKSLSDLGAAAESDIPDVSGFYTKPGSGIPASDLADGVIPDVSGFYTKPGTGIPASDLAAGVIPDVSGFYTKPSSGIPASDIADGVIPDPEDLIDDTAGAGDTEKVWSADKSSSLLRALNSKQDAPSTAGTSGQVLGLNAQLEPEWKTVSGGGIVDDEMSASSTNPVQNKVITKAIAEKASVIADTQRGNHVVIKNGENGMPFDSCVVAFDDLPSGITGIEVTRCNKNIFDEANAPIYRYYIEYDYDYNSRWVPSADSASYVFNARPNTTYIISANNPELTIMRVCALNVDPSTLSGQTVTTTNARNTPSGKKEIIFTTKSDERWIVIQSNSSKLNNRNCKVQIEFGINSSEYKVFNGNTYSISWGDVAGSVNSGFVDIVKGKLVTTEPAEGEYDITPVGINIADGVNVIYSNIGTIEAEYPANTKKYVKDIQYNVTDSVLMQLHTKPENVGVLNAIKRARQITDMRWTPSATLPRTAFVSGNLYSIGSAVENYQDEFTAGKEYVGLPYGDTNDYFVQIGTGRPIEVFITSALNPDSALCVESYYDISKATYYCGACTALTSYALGMPYVVSNYYTQIPNMITMFNLQTSGVRHSLDDLKLCDVLQINGHCALITDLYKDDNGDLYLIEVSENTRGGGINKDINGSIYGGIARRRTFNIDEFFDRFSGFCVMRYRDIDKVKYVECPYVQMHGEGIRFSNPYFPIMPYLGNKCLIKDGTTVDLIISATGYTHVVVKKNGANWNENGTTDPYVLNGNSITINCDNDTAEYSAQLATFENNAIKYGTVPCEWFVFNDVSVTATISNGKVNFVLTINTDLFDPWFTNTRNDQNVFYGGNNMVFDQFEHTQSGTSHIYRFSHAFSGSNPSKYVVGLLSDKYGVVEIKGNI